MVSDNLKDEMITLLLKDNIELRSLLKEKEEMIKGCSRSICDLSIENFKLRRDREEVVNGGM